MSLIKHYSVMVKNVLAKIEELKTQRTIKIADCNFGFGGHSHRILKQFPKAFMYVIDYDSQGFDLDPTVIQYYNDHYHN
jgi:16S rRNA C1402 N4-methylase RsmH